MALGLVQPRGDNTSTPLKNFPVEPFINSPRNKRSRTMSMNKTQDLLSTLKLEIKLDIVLETPVLVVPRNSNSPHVFVAHLGRISITNCDIEKTIANDTQSVRSENMFGNESEKAKSKEELSNDDDDDMFKMEMDIDEETSTKVETISNLESYAIDIKNMNLFSLDTTNRKGFRL